MKNINTESVERLFDVIMSLETVDECRAFF